MLQLDPEMEVFNISDTNHDQKLSFDEFVSYWNLLVEHTKACCLLHDVIRFLHRHNIDLQQHPDRALWHAHHSPTSAHFNQQALRHGNRPFGRVLGIRREWSPQKAVLSAPHDGSREQTAAFQSQPPR